MSKVVTAQIGPIHARDLRLSKTQVTVPVKINGVHYTQLVSQNPIVVADDSLEYAKRCAERVIENMHSFPNTKEAGDLIVMAYSVLHYTTLETSNRNDG